MEIWPEKTILEVTTRRRLALVIGLVCIFASGSDRSPVPMRAESSEVPMVKGEEIAPGVYRAKILREGDLRIPNSFGRNPAVSKETPGIGPVDPASIAGKQEWTAFLDDSFESGLLFSTWSLEYQGEGPWWDDWACWANSGLRSVGCAAAGENSISCGGGYPDNLWNWMVAGPFSFADSRITAAVLECALNLECEEDKDFFFMGISTDGTEFDGNLYTGSLSGYTNIDLVEAGVLGLSEVWVGFFFYSDTEGSTVNGAQIDDVLLAVEGLPDETPQVTVTSPNGGESWYAGSRQTITYQANDPVEGPEPLKISLYYSVSSGYHWIPIEASQANTGSYEWTVPDLDSDFVKIRVQAFDGVNEGSDVSDENFYVDPAPINNHLALGDAAGPSGTTVTVSLTLDNQDLVNSLQAELVFDGTKAFFTSIAGVDRGSEMTVYGEQVGPDRARIVVSHPSGGTLPVGSGEIADLFFTLQGSAGESTDLTLAEIILSNPNGDILGVDETSGSMEVQAPLAAPDLQISVLKNPGRTRTITILVRVANGSGSAPTVEAGGNGLPVVALGEAVFVGTYSVPANIETLEISCRDENALGPGTETYTVVFP